MLATPTLLAVTGDLDLRSSLDELFGERVMLLCATDGAQAMRLLAERPEIKLLAAEADDSLLPWMQRVRARFSGLPVLALARTDEAADAALRDGASEVLRIPCSAAEAERRALNLIRLREAETERRAQEMDVFQVLDHVSYGIGLYRYENDRLQAIYVNPTFADMGVALPALGANEPENILPMLGREDTETLLAHIAGPKGNQPLTLECSVQFAEGEPRRQKLEAYPVSNGEGTPPLVLISLMDVTRQHDTELALAKTSSQLRALIDTVPGGILIFRVGGRGGALYFNDTVNETLGYTREEYLAIANGDLKRHIAPEDRERVEALLATLADDPRRIGCDFRVLHKDGTERHVYMSCAPESRTKHECICNAVFLDITKEKAVERQSEQAMQELRYRAEHDELTGICNRESFYRKTEQLLQKNPKERYTLAILDIDRFKVVNDLFGKEAGDRVLVCLAETLKDRYHSEGTYARMESDQFALCCREGQLDCDRLHQAFQERLAAAGVDYHVEVSYGLYRVHSLGVPVLKMCDRAAMAMRTVKNSAVVRFAYYDDHLRQTLLEEQEIIESMNDALRRGEFVPYVQPIYNISTGKPVGAEVLIRWRHPERGFISPGRFVPLFERNGFITKLDASVWERACQMLSQWKAAGREIPLSVNMSRIDLYNPKLCELLESLLTKYGLQPAMLKLEITESAYTENPAELLAVVNRLREMGFHILMDDFGSGYSSLNTLKDMPVDTLKIDMRFLAELETSKRAASIITSVVRMAKWLDIPVIAEGVETQQQVDFLRSIGCDQVQGYFFARPMPVSSFEALLAEAEPSRPAETGDPLPLDLSAVWDANAQFNLLLNGMISGMGLYELDGDVLEVRRVNDAYYELFGITPQQLFTSSRDVLARMNPDDRQTALAACRRAVETRQVEQITVRRYHQDGRMMWIDVKLRYISKAGDHPVFYMTLSDITQQKEFEIERSFRQYTDVLRGLYRYLFELDYANDRVRIVYQAEEGGKPQVEDMPLHEAIAGYMRRIHPEDRAMMEETLQENTLDRTLTEQSHFRFEARVLEQAANEYRWNACHVFRFFDEARGRTLFLLGVQDIDERKRGQQLEEENHVLLAQQREQKRYLTLMEETGTTLLDWDLTEGGKFYSSSGFDKWRLSEYPVLEVVQGKHLEQVLCAEDKREALTLLSKAAQFKDATAVVRLQKKAGGEGWCRIRTLVTKSADGEPTRVAATISEIDEQIRMREDYLQSQAQFQAFADNYMVGLGTYEVWGGQSHATYLSDGFYRMMGYEDKEQFHADNTGSAYMAVVPDDCDKFDAAVQEIVRTREPFVLEYRAVAKDGRMRWLRTETCALPQKTGERLRLLAVIVDITELKETQRHLQCLLDEMPVGMGIFELEGDTVRPHYLNGRVPEMLGYSHEELMSGDIATLGDDLRRLMLPEGVRHARLRAGDAPFIMQENLQVRRKDGSLIWVQTMSRVATSDTGRPACYTLMTDVTDTVAARRRLRWQEERYKLLAEHTESILFDYDAEQDVMTFTLRTRELGKKECVLEAHLRQLAANEIIHSSFRDVYRASMQRALDHAMEGTLEVLADFTGDGYRWCRMYFVSVADEAGRVFRVVGRVLDIDREKEIEKRLRLERRYRQALLAETLYVYDVSLKDGHGSLLHAAPEAEERFLAWDAYLVEEKNSEHFHPDDWPALKALVASAGADAAEARLQCRLLDRSGGWVWVEASIHPLVETENGKARQLLYLKVVDKQKRREDELRARAELDPVSGVYNRATTEQRINEELASGDGCAFLLLDMDNFKRINDTMGHAMGDSAISIIGKALRTGVRSGDVVGRVGGDEFVVLLTHIAHRTDAMQKANNLLQELGEICLQEPDGLYLTASVGLTLAPEDGRTFLELYKKSDEAMYRAKSAGKGRMEVYRQSEK